MLEPVQLDTAIELGVVPVGAAVLSEATGVPAYLGGGRRVGRDDLDAIPTEPTASN